MLIRSSQFGAGRLHRSLAVLCVLVVLCSAIVEVVHLCPNQGISGAPCPICVTAQTTIIAIAAVILPSLLAMATVPVTRPAEPHSVYAGFDLFIRPPPSA